MSRSKIDIANEALGMVGADPISAFDDGSAEGQQVSAFYETVVGKALMTPGGAPFRWSFATRQDALTLLEAPPQARWSHAFQMPIDCLRLHAVTQNRWPIEFALHGDQIVTDTGGPLVADYTFRAQEADWPPDFLAAVVGELATRLAMGLNENAPLAAEIARGIDWRGVRAADSQARSAPRLRATRLTLARYGGSTRRW